jgi:ferredoxin
VLERRAAAVDAALAGGAAADKPLIHAATAANWQAMAELAKKHGCPLVIRAEDGDISGLEELSGQVTGAGVEDIVLDAGTKTLAADLAAATQCAVGIKKPRAPVPSCPAGGADRRPSWRATQAVGTPASSSSITSSPRCSTAAHAAPDHLHGPAEADPDGAKPTRSAQQGRQPRAHHDQLPHLLGGMRPRAPASPRGCSPPTAISRQTGWRKPDAEKIAKTVRDRVSRTWFHKKLIIPGHVAGSGGRERCPTGRSRSARVTPSTSPTTSRTSGAHEREFRHEPRTAMASITFTPSGETIEVPKGTSLLDAAILCELDVPAPCAGQGRCGRCRVRVTSGEVERRSNAGLATPENAI